ncbi:nuclear transport factor 2 family protein [Actibacterium sp. XHP0104]|uniref:nuclear transport factor 2 family protein n=1 Tax=Actibacterium sp. XHP0104 TaxID=2984335 RepID=UPI0021E7D442|nr:nuclear transport factor 2 family protein [Actibacterium sp. XHP0104]MCV2882841.1 nuclear transport factor 2 family protein [Actibacterium sp. XHP0104]
MTSKRQLLQTLLKGIETGEAKAAAVVNESKYIQHNPQTHEGSEGLATLFARLAKTNPKVTFIRVFEDGDYAFAHNEYDFSSLRAAFEVFRFENGQAVEHWDNIQPLRGPNPSGRGMLDGQTQIRDLDQTEANRALARDFVQNVLIARQFDRLEQFLSPDLIQHDPDLADGIAPLHAALARQNGDTPHIRYERLHKVLAEGNFVLCMSEGHKDGAHTSFYNLFRIDTGKIVEHWNTVETIAPRSEWKNDNGKF